jgi:pyrimidine-nucleoside phosphorylase
MFKKFIKAQSGDISGIKDYQQFPRAKYTLEIIAPMSGWINGLTARTIGLGSMQLGAGRQKKSDPIDLGAGIYLHKKIGAKVKAGDRLATLYTNKKKTLQPVAELVLPAWSIGSKAIKAKSVVVEVL